jgi:DNA topoisomerase VI subunit A
MQVSSVQQHQIQQYNLEQRRLQEKREEDYRKLVEKRNLDRIAEERVERNIRLDLEKGRNIDIEC